MRVAVIYATVEGQTRRIAAAIAERTRAAGHEAAVLDAAALEPAAGGDALAGADAAILCGPLHAAQYPAPLVHFARAEAARLNALPGAFVSVSLGILGEPDERREAEGFAERFFAATGWHPGAVHHAAGALRFSQYDFFKRWFMRLVARRHGFGVESGDHEFTDYAALGRFVDDFLAGAAGTASEQAARRDL